MCGMCAESSKITCSAPGIPSPAAQAVALRDEVREHAAVSARTSARRPRGCVSAYSCARNPKENYELRRANEILNAASVFFATELDADRPK